MSGIQCIAKRAFSASCSIVQFVNVVYRPAVLTGTDSALVPINSSATMFIGTQKSLLGKQWK